MDEQGHGAPMAFADPPPLSFAGYLRADAERYLPGWRKLTRKPDFILWMRLLLLTPGFQFVFWLRLQRALRKIPLVGGGLSRIAWYITNMAFASDIDPSVRIGPGLHVPHPTGIVMGGGSRLGRNVTILQNATLGQAHRGTGETPRIGDDVEIGVGACVLGDITIGKGAIVGANSVVLKDVSAGAVAVGVPARELPARINRPG